MAVLSIIYIFFIKLAVCNVYNQYSNVSVLDSEGFDALLQSEGTFLCQFYSEKYSTVDLVTRKLMILPAISVNYQIYFME